MASLSTCMRGTAAALFRLSPAEFNGAWAMYTGSNP